MRPASRVRKLLAFAPALVAVGAFVGCRGGAFDRRATPDPPPAAAPAGPTAGEGKPVFIGGSKAPNMPAAVGGLRPAGPVKP